MASQEEKWIEKYKLIVEYYEKYGNIDVPQDYVVNGIKLGRWLNNQRDKYKKGKLSEKHIYLLEKLGVKWSVKTVDRSLSWYDYYNLLVEYKKKYGNIDVPQNYVINGVRLGPLLNQQRQAYKGQSHYKLTDEQIKLLEDLGIKWSIRKMKWDDYYELLVEYKKKHGNIDVPQNYVINGVNLGKWLDVQRQAYRGCGRSKITKEHIRLLEDLGIKWSIRKMKWDDYYELLVEYKKKYGNIDVPQYYVVNGIRLGAWLNHQRQAYKENGTYKITKQHIFLLNELGIDWSLKDTIFLNREITSINKDEYNVCLLNRMKHILEDLSYEDNSEIIDLVKQKEIEAVIVKRLFR